MHSSLLRLTRVASKIAPRLVPTSSVAFKHITKNGTVRHPLTTKFDGNGISTRFFSTSNDLNSTISYPPPQAKIGHAAPTFLAKAVVDGEITLVDLKNYRGKYVVLFFYPKDFTFVCPTEIIAFSDRAKEFEAINAQLIACSTDTEECHLAWTRLPRKQGGLGKMNIPIVADVNKQISNNYGVLHHGASIALRGLFIINPEGILEQITVNNFPVGRSVDETLRLLQAFQFVREHGEVCPANWQPGGKTMIPNPEDSQAYFASGATENSESKDENESTQNSKLISISNKKEFDSYLSKSTPVVVDFMANWCGKCQQLLPFVEKLAEKHPNVKFLKVDTSVPELENLSHSYQVQALPSLHFFHKEKEVLDVVTGYKKKILASRVEELEKLS